MKKTLILCLTIVGLCYTNDSFGMLRFFRTAKKMRQKRHFFITQEQAIDIITELEKTNKNIKKILHRNEKEPSNENQLRLHRIREYYGKQVLACNEKNLESLKESGPISLIIPSLHTSLFYQFDDLIKAKE